MRLNRSSQKFKVYFPKGDKSNHQSHSFLSCDQKQKNIASSIGKLREIQKKYLKKSKIKKSKKSQNNEEQQRFSFTKKRKVQKKKKLFDKILTRKGFLTKFSKHRKTEGKLTKNKSR